MRDNNPWQVGVDGSAAALVGRAEELRRIRALLRTAGSSGGALLLTGEAGVGKTALLEAAAGAAGAAGWSVVRAVGTQFLDHLAFAALQQVTVALHPHLGELGEVHRRALGVALGGAEGPRPERLVVFGAVLELLCAAAEDRPLLLVVDDLQWLDEASRAAVLFVGRRVSGHPLAVLAGVRTGEGAVEAAGLPGLSVPPLEPVAAEQLLGTRFPLLTARERQRVLGEAEGNPLALLEMPVSLTGLPRSVRTGRSTVLPLSRRLEATYSSRLTGLPVATRQLLLLAALDADGGARAHGSDRLAAAELGPAEEAGLASADPRTGRIAFRHPLVRAAVVTAASPEQRRVAHLELARRAADNPDRCAWHLGQAATDPDEPVAGLLDAMAARVLRRGDSAGAVSALLRAAELSPANSDRARRLARAAYVGADVVGDLTEARELLVEARRADPALPGSVVGAVATAYVLLNGDGNVNAAFRVLLDALTADDLDPRPVGADDEGHLLAEAVISLLEVCLYGARAELWPRYHDLVARIGLRLPEEEQLVVSVLSDPARTTGQDVARMEQAIRALNREVDPTRIERVATAALFLDRATDCRQALRRVVQDGRDGGATGAAINAQMVLCIEDVMTGRWAEADRLAEDGLALVADHGHALLAWPFRLGQALLAAGRGQDDLVSAVAAEIDAWARPRGADAVAHYARLAQARAALGRGEAEAAFVNAAAISPPGVLAPYVPLALWTVWELVQSAVDSGRTAAAVAHVAACRDLELDRLSPRLAMVITGAAALSGAARDAGDLFEEALSVPGAQRWPFDLARVELAYGRHLHRCRDHVAARRHLVTAQDLFVRLGAAPWAAMAAGAARAAGARQLPTPVLPDRALTAQERRIAELAASGLTNREIAARLHLSHRTVGGHLRRVFTVLGITSRAALRDALASVADDGPMQTYD